MALTFDARSYDDPDIQRMVADVQAEYVILYGGPDESAITPDEFGASGGLFVVGVLDGVPVAMGGWRRFDGQTSNVAEIKRMYVATPVRRRGLSRLLLAELERTAAAAGVRRLVLNTGQPQHAALALYRSAGYAPTAAFGHYADAPLSVFLGKDLLTGSE